MKILIILLFSLSISSSFTQVKEIKSAVMIYDHHEIMDQFCFTVFKNNDMTLTFFKPDFKEYGDGCAILEMYKNTYFNIEYRPHGSNPKYSVITSFSEAQKEDIHSEADYVGLECSFTEEKTGQNDGKTTKICTFKDVRFESIGTTNYKGETYWEYQVYHLEEGEFVATKNNEVFNDKQKQLEKIINAKIKEEYAFRFHGQDSMDCFGSENAAYFGLNSLSIKFESDQIVFVVDLGLTQDCSALNYIYVPLPMSEVEQYFK